MASCHMPRLHVVGSQFEIRLDLFAHGFCQPLLRLLGSRFVPTRRLSQTHRSFMAQKSSGSIASTVRRDPLRRHAESSQFAENGRLSH